MSRNTVETLKTVGIAFGVVIVIAFVCWLILLGIQCEIETSKVDIVGNAAEYVKSSYPNATLERIQCEYEDEDRDYECKAVMVNSSGTRFAVEVDCKCSCGEWGGCIVDMD